MPILNSATRQGFASTEGNARDSVHLVCVEIYDRVDMMHISALVDDTVKEEACAYLELLSITLSVKILSADPTENRIP